jgi:uncharacterized protein (TIGR01244 family)
MNGKADSNVLIDIPNACTPAAGLCTGGRPSEAHLREARARGIRTVVNLCPHSEPCGYDEPALVQSLGMHYVNIPIAGAADLTTENARLLTAAIAEAGPKHPVLVHCASGNRVGALFAIKARRIDGAGVEEALAIGRSAGLKAMEPAVRQLL